jgi:signal-transduction protein with cAMP-binding, CBS, and nucleotidyltransferase domain
MLYPWSGGRWRRSGADGWFAALAEHLAATLELCGLVRCPGGIMATNPGRRVPLAAADLAAAFEYVQQVRLRHQAGRLAAGAVPDDAVPLAEFTALQRRWLKDTAELLRTCQESVRIAYRTDLIG